MKNNKKKIITVIAVAVAIITLEISLAMFSYMRTGSKNSRLIVGDIYMKYAENNTNININNMIPSSTKPTSYFEFTIEGTNTTTNKDIYYDINITYGDTVSGKTRIDDKFLKFTLEEDIGDGNGFQEKISNKSYSDFSSGLRIYVDKILKNTTTKVTHTYRLYVWIDDSIRIYGGDLTSADGDYSVDEWNNLYASVKVNVTGDFNEKTVQNEQNNQNESLIENATPANCFTTIENQDGTLTIVEYDYSCPKDVVIPNMIDVSLFPPTSISNNNYQEKNILTKIPNNLRKNLSNNLSKMDNNNWKKVTIIGDYSFENMEIKSVVIPNSVTIIGDGAFKDNQNLSHLELGENVTTIGRVAFHFTEIKNLVLNDKLTSIGSHAFSNEYDGACNDPTSVLTDKLIIPNSVTSLGYAAFACFGIADVEMPNNFDTIPDRLFYSNPITYFEIPDSVTTIGERAFSGSKLRSIVIPNSVTTIGEGAFSWNQLTSLEIPNSVTTIGYYAFERNQLTSVVINTNNLDFPSFLSLFDCINEESIDTVIINNAISIPDYMFDSCNINNLILGNRVTTIGKYALALNHSGANIVIPNTVTSIASDAFGAMGGNFNVIYNGTCSDLKSMIGYPFGVYESDIKDKDNNICANITQNEETSEE